MTSDLEELFNVLFDLDYHKVIPAIEALALIALVFFLIRHRTFKIPTTPSLPLVETRSFDGPEIIIVGAGVAGASLAAALGQDGRRVLVIEKELKEPDRIIGELLQPGGYQALQELNLLDSLENTACATMKGYVVHDCYSQSNVVLHYPKDKDGCIMVGKAFHHGRFITGLRRAVSKQNTVTLTEGSVTKLILDESGSGAVVGVIYRCRETGLEKEVRAPLTVVADGCFSKLRKSLVQKAPSVSSHFVGMLMEDCPQYQWDHAEIVLANPSPVLIYKICPQYTRVLVDIPGQLPKDMKEYMLEKVYSQLPAHIQTAFASAVENAKMRIMPNNWLPPTPIHTPGVFILGDAFNMRHPLTGGGMTVAFNDVICWRNLLRNIPDLSDHGAVADAVYRFYADRKNHHSFVVNVMAQALYALFAADDEDLSFLRRACFQYFQFGGPCVKGPMNLLSVLSPRPFTLISHFFAVAFYATWVVFKTEPLWAAHRIIWRAASVLHRACTVIFPLIWSEMSTTRRMKDSWYSMRSLKAS